MEEFARYLLGFEFIRFLGIGGFGTLLYYAIYSPLTYIKKERYAAISIVAFAPSLAITFLLHKYWTFVNSETDVVHLQITLFLLQRAVMFVINLYFLRLLVKRTKLHPFPAQLVSHAVFSYPSYLALQPIFAL